MKRKQNTRGKIFLGKEILYGDYENIHKNKRWNQKVKRLQKMLLSCHVHVSE